MAEQVGAIYYDVSLDTSKLIHGERDVRRRLDRVGEAGDGLQRRFSAIASAISAALAAIAVEGLISKLVNTQRQFDVMFASLKTVTGGTKEANEEFERLREFAASTPYSLDQAVQGFVKLKALGLDPSSRAMTSFGNTAAAMGKDLSQMIEAVADASTGEFERLKEFGIKAKAEGDKVSLTFRGTTTTIKNSSAEIIEYLTNIGETDFAGAMSERMKTLDGDISNLQDSLSAFYLSLSQSGIGDAIAAGVRKATEAVQELTTSVKEGGLTEYFEGLRPLIAGAELAVVALSGAIAGRLIAAMAAAIAQAYASASAMGAATLAARGFTAVLTALGGPIGIAITGLTLLALNWDKVAGQARDAATMSEEAAQRIANALNKSSGRAARELAAQLAEARDEIALIDRELARSKDAFPRADPEQLAELKERRDTLVKISNDITQAMGKLQGQNDPTELARRGRRVEGAAPAATGGGTNGGSQGKAKFDAAAYMAGLEGATADAYRKIDLIEQEALRKNEKLRNDGLLSLQQYERAKTLIATSAENERAQLRQEIQERSDRAQISAAEVAAGEASRRIKEEAQDRLQAVEYAAQLTRTANPADALRQEYEAKLGIVAQYEQLMAQTGVSVHEQAEMARMEISREYERQRMAMAEQSFRSQSDANAFLMDSINSLAGSATNAIVGLINGTMTASDVMRSLGNVILNEAVGSLVQVGVQMVKNAILGDTLAAADKARKAANGAVYAASVSAQVAGMSALAAQNAFTATAAIPIIGPALAPAAAAAAAAASAALGAPAVATAPVAGARQYGGPVSSGSLYRINETGRPEMFTAANGSQYMLPTANGSVTPASEVGAGGAVEWKVIVNNNAPGAVASASVDRDSRVVTIAVAQVAEQIANNSGPVWSALRGSSNVQGRM